MAQAGEWAQNQARSPLKKIERRERRTPAEEKLQELYRSKVNPLRSELGLEELDVRNESDYFEKLDERLWRIGLIEQKRLGAMSSKAIRC